MATKPTFASLKLKVNSDVKEITINDKIVEVKQYLPMEDKINILEIAIQKADEATVTNTLALDALFHVYIVLKYTNLVFTDTQKENLFKLYDILETNDIITQVVSAMPEEEYSMLYNHLQSMLSAYGEYRNSAKAVFEQFQMFAPNAASDAAAAMNQFDTEKLKDMLGIAQATGFVEA